MCNILDEQHAFGVAIASHSYIRINDINVDEGYRLVHIAKYTCIRICNNAAIYGVLYSYTAFTSSYTMAGCIVSYTVRRCNSPVV